MTEVQTLTVECLRIKEENTMTYVKPEVLTSDSAVQVIQSSTRKIEQFVLETMDKLITSAAYEADE